MEQPSDKPAARHDHWQAIRTLLAEAEARSSRRNRPAQGFVATEPAPAGHRGRPDEPARSRNQ